MLPADLTGHADGTNRRDVAASGRPACPAPIPTARSCIPLATHWQPQQWQSLLSHGGKITMDVLVCVSPLSRLGAPSSRLRRGSFALGTGRTGSPMRKPHVPCEWSRLAGRPSHGAGPSPPTSASKCNEHAAFSSSSGCGPYLVRMIQGKKARPIQKDGTLQRVLVGGPGPAPTVGHPWVGPPGASTWNEHAAFSSL